jgi:hypothetical protein
MNRTRTFVLVLLCTIAIASPAAAQCGDTPAKGVCAAATSALETVRKLQQSHTPAEPCYLQRIGDRLEGLLFGLPEVKGLVPEDFASQTSAITQNGYEFAVELFFVGEPDEVVISLEDGAVADPAACSVAPADKDPLVAAVGAVAKAVAGYNKPILVSGAVQLRKLSNTWTWMITDGFGQFPWERLFNDVVHRQPMSIFRLPRTEWVLVHPSVGAAFTSLNRFEDSRGQVSLLIEPFGVTLYQFDVNAERRSYWGASALVTMTGSLPPGVGGLLRFNKYSLGVVRHVGSGERGGDWSLTASVELVERLQPARKKLQQLKARASGAASAVEP